MSKEAVFPTTPTAKDIVGDAKMCSKQLMRFSDAS